MADQQAKTPAPLAFLDTETDGVHPGRKVWEVAVIRREPDGTETEWSTFVDLDLTTADPFGLSVGRFYERHPMGKLLSNRQTEEDRWGRASLPPQHAARKVAQMTHGAHLVGAVPNFDAECLDWLLREHGLIPAWHYHLVDVEALAIGYLAALWPERNVRPPWKSDEVTSALGLSISDEDKHTALGDARWAQRIYDRVVNPALAPKES